MDTIACVAVNDAFVMDAWGKSVGADGKILLLADGSALFTKVLGFSCLLATPVTVYEILYVNLVECRLLALIWTWLRRASEYGRDVMQCLLMTAWYVPRSDPVLILHP